MEIPETVRTKDLAYLLGITPRGLKVLEDSGQAVKRGRGKWDLRATIQARIEGARQAAIKSTDANAQRARLLGEQADAKAMENAVTRDELVPVGEVEQALQSTLVDLVQFLDSLGARVAGQMPAGFAQQAKALIDAETEKARLDLVERWKTVPHPSLEDGDSDATADEDAGPVG